MSTRREPETIEDPGDASTHPLQDIVGQELDAVTFVRDYVQLKFGVAVVSVLTPMRIHGGALETSSGEVIFRQALCDQIGKSVLSARVSEAKAITIELSEETRIEISLQRSDYVGAEAVIVDGRGSRFAVL